MALTIKNKQFLDEYIANGYKEQAKCYEKIYPDASWDTCLTNSSKVLSKPEAKEYMREQQKERFERLNVTAERIAEKLSEMAFGDDENLKPSDRARALDLLQKQMGLQKQNIKADVDQTTVIKISVEGE